MKKLRVYTALFLSSALLAGCSADENMYTVTSNSWNGEAFIQTVNDEQQISYTLQYIADDLQTLQGEEYTLSVTTPYSEHTRQDSLNEDGIIETNDPSHCTGCLDADGTLHIDVTIEVAGTTETLTFEPKN